ncbi:hypothetical protein GCM10029992_45000 [Glycomyces albus]
MSAIRRMPTGVGVSASKWRKSAACQPRRVRARVEQVTAGEGLQGAGGPVGVGGAAGDQFGQCGGAGAGGEAGEVVAAAFGAGCGDA